MHKLLRNVIIASALTHTLTSRPQTAVQTTPTDNQVIIQPPDTALSVSGSGNFNANNLFVGNGYIWSNPNTDLLLQSGQTGTLTFDTWSYGQGVASSPPNPDGSQPPQPAYYGAISSLLPGNGNGDFMISDADAQLTFFCADTTNDFVGVGAASRQFIGQPITPVAPLATTMSTGTVARLAFLPAIPKTGLLKKNFTVAQAASVMYPVPITNPGGQTLWSPACVQPFDVFDISNRETFGDGYMHWYSDGEPAYAWNAGISNPSPGTLSFDSADDGDSAATIQVGSILFPDGSTQYSASQVGSNGTLAVQSPTAATITVQSTAAMGSSDGAIVSLVGNVKTWNIESFNDSNPGVYPGSLGITDGNSSVVRQLFDSAGDVYIGLKTGDGTVTSSSLTVLANGNIGVATSSPGTDLASLASPPNIGTPIFEVGGDVALTQGQGGQVIFQDGTVQSTAWNGTTLGGDYAESVDVTGRRSDYEPGDLIVIDPSDPGKFKKSQAAYSRLVAGIFSTKPGLTGRRIEAPRPDQKAEVPMAMMGIVPTKVSTENGSVEPGDLLVSSSTPGYAMKGSDSNRLTGAVIGKALAPLHAGLGVIEVLISLQ